MAILNSCCCWRSVRRGSFACAVYSTVYYLVLAASLWKFPQTEWTPESIPDSVILADGQKHYHLPVINHLGMVMLCLSLVGLLTCLLLFIGLCKDVKLLLLPWLVDAVLVIIVDLVFVAYIVYQEHLNLNPVVAITFTVDFFLLVLHTYAVLCVTSQYQEYRDGRGTAMDDGNRWVPVIRYTAQSTLNSGAESTRRTISFLDHGRGLSTNGCSSARSFYSSTNSRSPSRSPSTITKDCGKRSTARARSPTTTYLLPGDPTLPHRVAKTGNNHVQFITPDNEVTEMEPTAVETSSHQCLPLNSENSIISPVHDPIETVTSITAPREVPSLSGIVYMTAPREVSSLSGIASTSRGPEATPLIGQESPEESNRY